MKLIKMAAVCVSVLISFSALAGDVSRSASPHGALVYIVSPVDGAAVTSPVKVIFGLSGMGVAPAGTDKKHTGHHHLLVDGKKLPAMNHPMKKEVKHFGGGQTETVLELAPGKHTLQLILGDKGHVPHEPPVVSEVVTIVVK